MYKSITIWRDLTDGHLYHEGDKFPFDGRDVSEKRIVALANGHNLAGKALIKPCENPDKETPIKDDKPVEKPKRGRKKAI